LAIGPIYVLQLLEVRNGFQTMPQSEITSIYNNQGIYGVWFGMQRFLRLFQGETVVAFIKGVFSPNRYGNAA
jgi:hypothetical protein